MSATDNSFFQQFKPKTLAGWALSALFFAGSLIVQYTAAHTHTADIQAQQEQRIQALEKESATRRELDGVKEDVKEIKGMLLQELQYHGIRK